MILTDLTFPEHRLLYTYWNEKRGDHFAPCRKEIDPLDIPQLLSTLLIYKVHNEPLRYEATLMGTRIVRMFGQDHTGKYIDEFMNGPTLHDILKQFGGVLNDKEPSVHDIDASWIDKEYLKYSRLLLPLSDDRKNVNHLLACVILHKR